ncbi:MAG: hypothetical protein KC964_05755, partial [Candidatus Omnitrophica bacterium]|nr:hypothetical protein [Candidatus Omnitrophota bacterium]
MVRQRLGFLILAGLFCLQITPGLCKASELKAGVAKCLITNSTPRILVNGPLSEGVNKDITARALTLNDGNTRLVFVTYDLNCLDVGTPILRKRVQEELGLDPSHLILLATHNHNAPIQINPKNFDYGRWLADRLFDLIQEAIENETGPVRVEFGFGDGYFVASSGNAPTDYEIQMLKVMKGDNPHAILFTHPTHPFQCSEEIVGAGHPGYAMEEMEEALPDTMILYADSCGGNQFPLPRNEINKILFEGSQKGTKHLNKVLTEYTKEWGHKLAQKALEIADGDFVDVTGPLSATMEIISLPLRDPIPREDALKLIEDVPEDVGFVPYPHENRNTNWVRMLLRYYDEGLPFPTRTTDMICTDDTYLIHKEDKEFLEKYDYSIHDELPCVYEETIVAMIGDMPFVAMQGEVCAPIGMRIKDTFRTNRPIFVTAYMGEHNLYIPTREIVRL